MYRQNASDLLVDSGIAKTHAAPGENDRDTDLVDKLIDLSIAHIDVPFGGDARFTPSYYIDDLGAGFPDSPRQWLR